MGFLSNLFGRSNNDYDYETEDGADEESGADVSALVYKGITLEVGPSENGGEAFSGRVSEFNSREDRLTLERLPGALSLKTREIGSSVELRGCDKDMKQFMLKATVQESTRLVCRLKDVRVKPIPELRENFRLQLSSPATMYSYEDIGRNNPEECTLVDISTGGACVESEYLHAEDEVLRLKIKLEAYVPREFVGEIIRVVEYRPGKFRYGCLLAPLEAT
ncbi:MAG: PilZ domain-containing protein [Oscillospiraceae bacterium]|nr:PilZ domain-containing protein [Oscillospiraceae bacterium]